MTAFPASRRPRLAPVSEPGRLHLITTTTWNHAPVFREHEYARAVSRLCHSSRTWTGAACLAWVLMPDQWYGLIELHEGDLCKVVGRFKSLATRAVNRQRRRGFPLWQKGFDDTGLCVDDDVRTAARHLVAMPVRAGLCETMLGYPYWNAVWL